MTSLYTKFFDEQRNALRIPLLALALCTLGCAETEQSSADDLSDGAETAALPAAQATTATNPAAGSVRDWPEPCDAVYRLTVDNNGKGPKQKIPPGAEIHPQVYLDAPWGNEDVQAVAFRPITDNKKVLHHWIAYSGAGGSAYLIGWAPGQEESDRGSFPPDVGMYLPKGPRALRFDMHYYNLQGKQTEEDASGVEICVTKRRKFEATTFTGFSGIPILPANKKTDITGVCKVRVTQPVFLLTHSAHAHKLAYHMKFTHTRGNQVTVLHDGPFYFEEQRAAALTNGPLELKNGDLITTTCSFDNNTNRTVTFGENTNNEMCFNFSWYYPRGALSCTRP